jgi:signal transduction histidine kinase
MTELEQQIHHLHHGDHLCMVYETPEEQIAAITPFLRDGLKRKELCAYIADEEVLEAISSRLSRDGLDVGKEREAGSLLLMTKREAYLRGGCFDPCGMISYLSETQQQSLNRGYRGFRVAGQMSWALGQDPGSDRLIEYEALLNHFFPESKSMAICQYDRTRFSPEVIYNVLRTHPIAIIGDRVCTNIYYEPPELILENASLEHRVKWMLMQLQRAHDAEQKIRNWNHKLEEQVRQRTASLKESRDQLEAFAYSVSHDLRAPLRAMQGLSGILVDDYGPKLDQEGLGYLQMIANSAERMDKLISDLLEYSRIGQSELRLEEVNLEVPLRRALTGMNNVAADLRLPESYPSVWGANPLLEQVFRNLLSNAIKVVPPGVRPKVSVEWEETRGRIRVWVRDNGIGIPESEIPKLFKLFYRVQAGDYPGTGAGLALVQRAVERMGGEVGVESQAGTGSAFWFELAKSGK